MTQENTAERCGGLAGTGEHEQWPADTIERCSCDEALALRDQLVKHDLALDALRRIAALCGCPDWAHADQVVHAVAAAIDERDSLRTDLARTVSSQREGTTCHK